MSLTDAGVLSVGTLINCPMIVTNGGGELSCGSNPFWSNTGALAQNFDGRYVNIGGDTMTGALAINVLGGTINTIGLRVINTFSGAIVQATQQLRSSGTLITESGATLDGGTLHVAAGPNRVGIGTTSPKAALEVLGTISGSNVFYGGSASGKHLYAASTFGGAGLADCDGSTSKLLWDATTKQFSCGTVTNGGTTNTGGLATIFDGKYVNIGGDTMTGALTINLTSGTIGLEVIQTISGSTIFANNRLVSSGTLVTESGATLDGGTLHVAAGPNRVGIGTTSPKTALEVLGTISGANLYIGGSASGNHLYAASTFGGAGLADCDTAGTSKLLWDATAKTFSCGTDANSGTTNTGGLATIFDGKYVNIGGDTMTGALAINVTSGTINTIGLRVINTFSGAIVQATQQLRSSGTLITESGATLDGGTLHVAAGPNRVGIGTTSPKATLDVAGTISGAIVTVSDGGASTPSFRFTNDSDVGLYRAGTNSLGLAMGGGGGMTLLSVATAGTTARPS